MKKFERYARRFREIFGLSEQESCFFRQGNAWIDLEENPLGSILIEWGVRYEGVMGQIAWYRGRPVLATGKPWDLAPIVFIAEQLGLDVDHPYIQEAKKTPEYQEMLKTGRIILKE